MPTNWRQFIPTIITLMAMMSGFISILLALEGKYLVAAQAIMLAMVLDGLDGNLARWLKGTTEFGAELDTYVDLTAFGLAPAILIYKLTFDHHVDMRFIMTALVVLSGVIRLSRFKVKDPLRGQGGYCGLPITACAGWVAMFVMLSEMNFPSEFFQLGHGPVGVFFIIGVLIMISLQVSNVRYPKPTKVKGIFFLGIILVIGLFIPSRTVAPIAALILLLLGMLYVAFGPLFVALKKQNINNVNT